VNIARDLGEKKKKVTEGKKLQKERGKKRGQCHIKEEVYRIDLQNTVIGET